MRKPTKPPPRSSSGRAFSYKAMTQINVNVPHDLHPASKELVQHFAAAIADKLRQAEVKYGYRDGWKTEPWEIECRSQLYRHADKGDPCDVAIYAAFCWARGWTTRAGGILKLVWNFETERLRRKIETIATYPDEDNEWDGRDRFHECREIAREALKEEVGSTESK